VVDARARVARGEALFERGDYDAALAEFEAAYEAIGEHPSRFLVLYNIGQCHERRFRYDVALDYYRRYLDQGGRAEAGHEEVEANVRALETLLSTLEVSTSAPAAQAFVDGRLAGPVPGEVRVPAGLHVLSVRAEGFVPAERSLQVPAAGRLQVTLEPTRLSDEYHGISPVFSLVVAGLAVGALGVGIGYGLAAIDQRAQLDAALADPVGRWDVTIDPGLAAIRERALVADILYGSAGVLGLTALVLGVVSDWRFGADARDEVSVAIGPGSLHVQGAF
jgi:tetratricopeptide (TPR) repeat protein